MITDTFFDREISEAHFIPITINYERVMEGETFPQQLLGEEKVKESVGRLMRASTVFTLNFGKIYVEIGDFISLKGYTEANSTLNPFDNPEDRKALVNRLAYDITLAFDRNLIIMPTAVVSSIILMNQKGISEDELINQVDWLKREIKSVGGQMGGIESSQDAVRQALSHLPLKKHKDIFKVSVEVRADYQDILLLSYYRNTLIHLFVTQSYVACALLGFGHSLAVDEGVPRARLEEEAQWITELFVYEFQHAKNPDYEQLTASGSIQETNGKIRITNENRLNFLSSLIWPYIDAYWITGFYLCSVKAPIKTEKLINQIQWFADNMYQERVITTYESCSAETITNALKTFTIWNIIEKNEKDIISLASDYTGNGNENKLQEFVEHISQFRNPSSLKSVDMRSANMPFFPKL